MLCEQCGVENPEGSEFCKACAAPLAAAPVDPEKALRPVQPGVKPTALAHFLSAAWRRKGPILMALFLVLMMAMVFAPWAFIKLEALKMSIATRDFTGWQIYVGRILFFLSIIPLLVSVMLIVGIGTKRRVVETHICTFFGGVIFTVWLMVFAISEVLKSVLNNLYVEWLDLGLQVSVSGGQIATILLFLGFLLGIVITSYDRGRLLQQAGEGG